MKNREVIAVGSKDFLGWQWFQIIVDGVIVRKYHAQDADHALRIYDQLLERIINNK
jgi:hypothetical protein